MCKFDEVIENLDQIAVIYLYLHDNFIHKKITARITFNDMLRPAIMFGHYVDILNFNAYLNRHWTEGKIRVTLTEE